MVNKSKINEISDGDTVIKTSMDLPPVLSTIELQSLLLKKLRLAMDRLIESNAAMSAENSMLRHSTARQRMIQQYSDKDKLLLHFGGTSDQLKDRKSVRFSLSNVPNVGIDNLEEDRNSSPRQLKDFFGPELFDVKAVPLKEQLLMKEREIARWRKKFLERGDRVNELKLALRQKDKDSMNAINESNALVQKKSLEIKDLLDKQREIDVNKLKSKLPPDNASTSRFGAKPFSSIFGDKPMVKPTDYPNASFFLRLQRQDPKSNKGNYGETPRRAPAA